MSRKKKFGLSDALNQGFTETLNLLEKSDNKFRNSLLPLSKIELDPENPRKLYFNLDDAFNGISPKDPDRKIKEEEREKLLELAETIKSNGIINPIVVYKYGEKYRVAAGERRCLASILAGNNEIDVRIFNVKPKIFELKLLQWAENNAREDLSLVERVDNIMDIFNAYKNENPNTQLSPKYLSDITGLSKPQASYYISVIEAPNDIKKAVREGKIQSLDKAAILSKIKDNKQREAALEACVNGASLIDLRSSSKQIAIESKAKTQNKIKRGAKASRVNFGYTRKINVAKKIIYSILEYNKLKLIALENIDVEKISTFEDATNIFKSILNSLEKQ